MRFVVQRVKNASVTVEGEVIGKIEKGFLVLVGISNQDIANPLEKNTEDLSKAEENFFEKSKPAKKECGLTDYSFRIADKMVKKLIGLRIFRDENGKTNLDLKAVDGQLLIISQFTLYADCRKGNRPSFVNAAAPEAAEELYHYIIDKCKQEIAVVQEGSFGADMKVELLNEGPFTVILDSDEICH